MGIVRKNFLIVTLMMASTVLLILSMLYFAMPIYYNQVKHQELRQNYQNIIKVIDGKSKNRMLELIAEFDEKTPNLLLSVGDEGQIIYPDLNDEEIKSRDREYLTKGDYDRLGAFTETVVTSEGYRLNVQGEYAFQSLTGISQILLTFYPFVLVLILILVSLVSFVYSQFSNRRITAISEVTRQMQSLEAGIVCKVEGQDEIARLAQDINVLYSHLLDNMLELKKENERTLARQKQVADFVRMTSHELKTPIASILGLVEGMIYNVGDFKNHDKYLRQCQCILQEQCSLVQSILDATTLDLSIQSGQEEMNLTELIEQQLETYYGLAQLKNYDFKLDLQATHVKGNSQLLIKTIRNILDNAFRYTKKGGRIFLELKDHQLVLENEAEYLLKPSELDQVFQPFYRPDYSRAKTDGGTGIGLYLVKQILDKHEFMYQFEAVDEKMMRFTIDFFKKN